MGTFQGINAGDRVLFKTPHGEVRAGIAQRLLLFPSHVVVDAGGLHGRAAVVDAGNYIRHVPKRERAPVMRAGG